MRQYTRYNFDVRVAADCFKKIRKRPDLLSIPQSRGCTVRVLEMEEKNAVCGSSSSHKWPTTEGGWTYPAPVVVAKGVCVCVCVFIKLHITAQSGLVILVIICHSH